MEKVRSTEVEKAEVQSSVKSDNQVTLRFSGEQEIVLPLYEHNAEPRMLKSVSKITPIKEDVLVAEYGSVGLMELLTSIQQNKPIKSHGYYMVVGVGNEVPYIVKIGNNIFPKMVGEPSMRDAFDPTNKFSFEMLGNRAKQNKNLFAAVTIANNKAKSKVGLNLDSEVGVSKEVLDKMKQFADNKNLGNTLFKDDKTPFVNYKLMHYTNISAVIYDK